MIEKSLIVNEMLARIETELGTEISYIKYKEPALMQGKRHTLWNSYFFNYQKVWIAFY